MAGVLYHTALLKGILTRYRPETIILDFRPDELAKNAQSLQMLSVLLPYYRDHIRRSGRSSGCAVRRRNSNISPESIRSIRSS